MAGDTLARLRDAILRYDGAAAEALAREAMAAGIDPLQSIAAMTDAIREVGAGFGRGELWLPDLIGAAAAMKQGAPVIEDAIRRAGMVRESLGSVVVGTVFGDIHDIGKNMVATLLMANGFEVHDVGVNQKAEALVAAVERYQPDILAMSALMTMMAARQRASATASRHVPRYEGIPPLQSTAGPSPRRRPFAPTLPPSPVAAPVHWRNPRPTTGPPPSTAARPGDPH